LTALQLQRLLDKAGMTQRAAAKVLEIHERTMRKYCAGDLVIPKTVAMAMLHLFCAQTDATKSK
jgi:plasmid maintenance system antidote protein VapI